MLFTSMEFLFLFFPATVVLYFLLPHFLRNYLLLGVSLFFYAWGEPKFVFAMMMSILLNYLLARLLERFPLKSRPRKFLMALAVILNLGLLFVYKYANFVTANLRLAVPSVSQWIPQTHSALPIGISFFTFQAMSYVIDVYRGIPAQKKLSYVALYISFFPQLIAGPIVRYTTIMDQMDRRTITPTSFSKGILRFLYGFNKKMLLANVMAQVADTAFGAADRSVAMAWLGAVCYSLQIFFDFAGYSEMAIGLGQMFGFTFLENFNYPYISKTVTEFWRRWHISLGSWFRDYVYFPMGGSRVNGRWLLIRNLAVVWLATGIWHGANWTFLLWGILHGGIIILEKVFSLPQRLSRRPVAGLGYQIVTLLAVLFGWVLFRSDSLSLAIDYIRTMLGLSGAALLDDAFHFHIREYAVTLAAALICSTPVFSWIQERLETRGGWLLGLWECVNYALQLFFFLCGVSMLVMKAHNPFIYFNF